MLRVLEVRDRLVTFGNVTYTTQPPIRTDAQKTAAPALPRRPETKPYEEPSPETDYS